MNVSILAQPGGRALLNALLAQKGQHRMFQSSPSPGAGRCGPVAACCAILTVGFNPRPARGPGAALIWGGSLMLNRFQSSPSPGAGRCVVNPWVGCGVVNPFQSSPSPGAGRCSCSCPGTPGEDCFNPRPARGPGAAADRAAPQNRLNRVSILAQPGGRALPTAIGISTGSLSFQSSPSPGAGRCGAGRVVSLDLVVSILAQPGGRALRPKAGNPNRYGRLFQSSPSPGAGRCERSPGASRSQSGFNPRPARGPGAAPNR